MPRKRSMSLRDEIADAPKVVVVEPVAGDFIANWRFGVDAVMPPATDDPPPAPPVTEVAAPVVTVPVDERDLRAIREDLQRSMAHTAEVLALVDQLLAARRGGR